MNDLVAVECLESPTGTPPDKGKDHCTPQRAAGSADHDGTPALSASIAHLLVNRSALHAWTAHPRLNPNYRQEESAEFDYGRAAHSLLLEGDKSGLYVIEANDWRTKAAQEARDKARAEGKTPLLARQMAKVSHMVKVAREYVADSELAGTFDAGTPEHSLAWMEGRTQCRSRLDWLTSDCRLVIDYKTAANANPDAFTSIAVGYGYAMQEAFYRRGVKAVYGNEPQFVFLVQEKEPPFACSLVAFDPAMQEMGDRQVDLSLAMWERAMTTGEWRGYPNRIAYLEPPAWYAARVEAVDIDNLDERMNP